MTEKNISSKLLCLKEDAVSLITDFYELTMAAGYFTSGHNPRAVFEAFIRTLPINRQFLLAAGLEQIVYYLLNIRFTPEQIDWLRSIPVFRHVDSRFWEYLVDFKFTGDLWAVPEGTVVFSNEPLLRIEAPILECQIFETYILTVLNAQTLMATKAARIVQAAQGRPVVDFGPRRAHGPQAGLFLARASYIAGCAGTSNVYAAYLLGLRPVGTQAHSWIMSFSDEQEAFRVYSEIFPENTICLIDTYDTIEGAKRAARLGKLLKGVRLDSGNIIELSKKVRRILDDAGLKDVKIVVSSDLNEYVIDEILRAGAPVDLFGVGTDMATSKDCPALSIVYKLVAIEDDRGKLRPVRKLSSDKITYGGAKQIFRNYDPESGKCSSDTIACADEELEGKRLLVKIIENGRLVAPLPSLSDIREYAGSQIRSLPSHLLSLRGSAYYPVRLSERLVRINEVDDRAD